MLDRFRTTGPLMRRPQMADPLSPARDVNQTWPLASAVASYLTAFALMTWPWLLGRVAIPWDAKATFLPQIQFLAQSLWGGEWPWWNPYVFSGLPQIADPQSMIFSPPYLALAAVNPAPGPWAADVTLLAAMAAGGIGLILWFRDQDWHWAGALIAALAFSFGAAMAWRIQHTGQVLSLVYFPWSLLLLDRAVTRGSLGAGLGAGVFAACMVLGRDQVALLGVYLLIGRVIWLWSTAASPVDCVRASLLPLAAGGLTGLALIAIPVAMTVLLAAESNRPSIDFAGAGAGSLHPALLTTFVIPQIFGAAGDMADFWGPPSFAWGVTGLYTAQNVGQLYIGAIPLVLIAGAAAAGRLWDPDIRFFTISFAVVLLYGLGWYTPAFRAMYELLPGVNLYRRPADAVFTIGCLGAILAGYAVHVWFKAPWVRPGWPVAAAVAGVIALVFAAALVFGVRVDRLHRLPGPLAWAGLWLVAGAATIAWAAPRIALSPWAAGLALGLVTAADLGWNNGPSTSSALPPKTYEALRPDTDTPVIRLLKSKVVADATRRDRIELAGLGFHWPNASIPHRLENTLGYNPVRLGLYSRATGAEDHVGLPDQRKFSALMPSYRSRLSDLLGLRWIATGAPIESMDKRLQPGQLPLVAQFDGAFVYENPSALPRVLFATRARAAVFDDILATGRWPDFDPATAVLLSLPPASGDNRRPGTARISRYGQNRVEIDADSPDGGYVVLNDVWHPWWRAWVDGRPAEIERANVVFRAVAVTPGRHRVVMEFRPLDGMRHAIAERLAAGSTRRHTP